MEASVAREYKTSMFAFAFRLARQGLISWGLSTANHFLVARTLMELKVLADKTYVSQPFQ